MAIKKVVLADESMEIKKKMFHLFLEGDAYPDANKIFLFKEKKELNARKKHGNRRWNDSDFSCFRCYCYRHIFKRNRFGAVFQVIRVDGMTARILPKTLKML